MRDKKKFAFCLLSIGTAVTAIVGGIITLVVSMKPVTDIIKANMDY